MPLGLLLLSRQASIQASRRDQLSVRASLDDAAFVHDDDLVAVADTGYAVRDNYHRAVGEDLAQLRLDGGFRLRIDS